VVIGNGPSGQVLYGTTPYFGTLNNGMVFSLTPPASSGGSWTEAVLYNFTGGVDGGLPGGVVVGSEPGGHTVLYGTTQNGGTGGSGTVFSLTPPASPGGSWTETVLYNFTGGSDGLVPNGVVVGSQSNGRPVLYGITLLGGTGLGNVFSLTPPASPGGTWTETVLHSFAGGRDGSYPTGIVVGPDALYGTTSDFYGQYPSGAGTVFSLKTPASAGGSWVMRTLHDFSLGGANGGSFPLGGVAIGRGGVLYGTTSIGGTLDNGTVFSLTPPASPGGAWTLAVLCNFLEGGPAATAPDAGVAIGHDGVLYGTTTGGAFNTGTVYSLTPPAAAGGAWTETVLHTFTGYPSDGSGPEAGVVIGHDGVLYGTTPIGGASNKGTAFELRP
jgi:uncharacterized repeat protein (TIGR03803 family)